jgi:hypothetical protein
VDPSTPSASAAPRPTRLLVATAAIALVIGLVVGLVIGWQVEKRRVEDDVDRLRDKIEELRGRSMGDGPSTDPVTDGRLAVVLRSDGNMLASAGRGYEISPSRLASA